MLEQALMQRDSLRDEITAAVGLFEEFMRLRDALEKVTRSLMTERAIASALRRGCNWNARRFDTTYDARVLRIACVCVSPLTVAPAMTLTLAPAA